MNEWSDGPPPVGFRGPCMFKMLYADERVENRIMDVTEYDPVRELLWDHRPDKYVQRKRILSHCPLEWPKEKA